MKGEAAMQALAPNLDEDGVKHPPTSASRRSGCHRAVQALADDP
ncbi:MAG TPA: hypothetical protein VM687_18515 [Stenotrophomonas sp.]|nr:hypothetical protein [Stenotrophomonas sp.]